MTITNTVIEKYYYIIKVEHTARKAAKTYYKIGEATSITRPNSLVDKYNKLRVNTASILAFEKLPYKGEKRLNDKGIHAAIDSSILVKANPYEIKVELAEEDGKDEFFELVDNSVDIVVYINKVVNSIKVSEYRAKVLYDRQLNYNADQYHKVDSKILDIIFNKFSTLSNRLYQTANTDILLIGQFEFDFIASFAMSHTVVIWHDKAENRHEYQFAKLNDNIIYVNSLKEVLELSRKFNLIIANPPYGKVGANITKAIIDEIEFDEYINLLPANDYKRNTEKNLYNYQSDMSSIKDGFADAAVTTHLARIHKNRANNMTVDEFERSQYIDRQLDKYFEENSKRSHYAIDAAVATMPKNTTFDSSKSIFINHRDGSHRHLAYSKNCAAYSINVLNRSYADTFEDYGMKADKYGRLFDAALINFNTIVEKQNAAYFMYSIDGFKFISKLFNAINTDSWVAISVWFPKVDWTRSWTVEEILADYDYTEDEIKEVMEDLKNYKGMEN